MHNYPLTLSERLHAISVETARMAYPGSMSRGVKPVVLKGTKKKLEVYFEEFFPLAGLTQSIDMGNFDYELWHQIRIKEISSCIAELVGMGNCVESVAAKFLNTFMHQLIKYEEFRPLIVDLHLPLDARVFEKLKRLRFAVLSSFADDFKRSPYSLPYSRHTEIQAALLKLVDDLNSRIGVQYKIRSRIELNWLWV